MLAATLLLLGLGLSASIVLAIAARAFYVWEDPKVLAISDVLPGANCGGCGQAGCAAAAAAIAAGQVPVNACVVGGFEVALAVGEIMGQKVEAREPEFSYTSCIYGVGEADPIFAYNGATDCQAAVMLYGGSKLCPVGCIGLGSCVAACQFDAIRIGDHNLPVVDYERCVGCGACVKACPKNIVTLTSATLRIVNEYRAGECTAPCMRACPTGINIRGYIAAIRSGQYEEALNIIKEKCPLPLVCGYICPAPCELNCRRNLVDEAVSINQLKRFLADHEMATGKHVNPYKAPDNGKRIALVGGGSEGLTAGYYLARLGYQPTLFEAKPDLGGILRYVISEDRLPRNVLDHDIKGILEMGVEARTGTVMGRDFTVGSLLREGYDAVLFTSGGFDSRKILLPEQNRFDASISGMTTLLDFLAALSRGEASDPGKHVVVVETGPKGLDVALKCRELGADRVTIVSHESFEAMPMALQDSRRLREKGIQVRPSTVVAAVGGVSDRLLRVALEDLEPLPGALPEREIMDADTLVLATARLPELAFVLADGRPETPTQEVRWQTIETFRTFPEGGRKGILGSPEPGRISDASAVVKSILSGRRLSRAVHQHFTDERISPIPRLACEAVDILDVTEVHAVPPSARQRPAALDVEGDCKRAWIFPKEYPGLEESEARRESERCLQCGLICYEKLGMDLTEKEDG
jgi:NADPH-dependent glutamate synthase beta subunit-like oxidoreductase